MTDMSYDRHVISFSGTQASVSLPSLSLHRPPEEDAAEALRGRRTAVGLESPPPLLPLLLPSPPEAAFLAPLAPLGAALMLPLLLYREEGCTMCEERLRHALLS
jgi:hypothetical protein